MSRIKLYWIYPINKITFHPKVFSKKQKLNWLKVESNLNCIFFISVKKHSDYDEKSPSSKETWFLSLSKFLSTVWLVFSKLCRRRFFRWQKNHQILFLSLNSLNNLFQSNLLLFNSWFVGFCCLYWWCSYRKDHGEIQWKWMVETSGLEARTIISWFYPNQKQNICHWWIYWRLPRVSESLFEKIFQLFSLVLLQKFGISNLEKAK